ncbi:response regulator transcription factor [Streptosporangium algeriense]|uniref:Response regulator transcription factor n=1 Tax=Streptosporangium algeriense TaxID=1682748 RepID=A0ABW3DLE1_9ACTN
MTVSPRKSYALDEGSTGTACDTAPAIALEPDALAALSARQREVLILLGLGLSNRVLARRLGITERTAKAHVTCILDRLGLRSRLEAALVANMNHAAICRICMEQKENT